MAYDELGVVSYSSFKKYKKVNKMRILHEHQISDSEIKDMDKIELIKTLNERCMEEVSDNATYLKLANVARKYDSGIAALLEDVAEDERRHSMIMTRLVKALSTLAE